MSKAWLAYQKRVHGGYIVKIGRAANFDEVLETLKFSIPSSARRYNPDKKDWFVAEQYTDVLEDLFYDFRPTNASGDYGPVSAGSYTSTATYQNRQSTSNSYKGTPKRTPKENNNTGCWAVVIIAALLLWWNWPTSNAPSTSTVEQNSSNEPVENAVTDSDQLERNDDGQSLGDIEALLSSRLDCPHVVNRAIALDEPRLSANVLYTVPINECLVIQPVGKEVSGVPWYELADGAWLRATLVENQPHWEFEQVTTVITHDPEPTEQLATVIRNANVRSGPCLNHPIERTIAQGATLSIAGHSRENNHVWYNLSDGGWIREDLVRDAPNVPQVTAPPCPAPTTATVQNCRGGCTTYPAFCAPPIKGNVSFNTGEKIYHMPGQQYYDATVINPRYGERWFCTEDEAREAGWRKALR